MALPSVQEMEAYIRQAAQARGIDPDIAVKVARSEGLKPNTWQSDLQQPYGRERSYGPFQLHVDPTGKRPGMGNDFVSSTGLNPADPTNWRQTIDFALDQAATGGWSPWMGAAKVDVTGKMGINGGKAIGMTPAYTAGPGRGSIAGYRTPGAYSGGEFVPGVEKTFYDDNSPLHPGGILPAVAEATGDFRPSNFQRQAARQADEGDQSQRARLLQAAGLDPTGKTRLAPRGTDSNPLGGILAKLKENAASTTGKGLDAKLAAIPSNLQSGLDGGILARIFKLFS